MHFDLGHVKSRSRSAQLEKTLMNMATFGAQALTEGKKARTPSTGRSGSLPLMENTNLNNAPNSVRNSIRGSIFGSVQGRQSIVNVDDAPPKLSPMQLMNYDELYAKLESEEEEEVVEEEPPRPALIFC